MSYPPGAHEYSENEYERAALRHPDGNTPRTAAFSPVTAVDRGKDRGDSLSFHSDTPLAPQIYPPATAYAPIPPQDRAPDQPLPTPHTHFPAEVQQPHASNSSSPGTRPTHSRRSSWDFLSGLKKIEHQFEGFDSRNASEAHLQFAEGDIPKNRLSRFYNYLLNVSIITRWFLFIVPVLGLLWIPGILGLTAYPDTRIWRVPLIWWSIWFSVVWGGWWGALATARILPTFARYTVGVVAVATRRYVDWLAVLTRYVAFFGWSLTIWISFNPLINARSRGGPTPQVSLITRLLFALFLCAALLLFEKFSIQWIAGKFHERSYADRIADQKAAIRTLVKLYAHSSDIVGRTDTLKDGPAPKKATTKHFFRSALKGFRNAATTTTTALGNVASEIAGSSVLQPNSPQAMVQTALASANKTRLLARRLYYSFRDPRRDALLVEDIVKFFRSQEEADIAFSLFDKDSNGDATRDEVEMACMEVHREQLSIEHSMRDLDSAVGRLDNILMSLYVIIALLILAVALETQLLAVITGAGTLLLGLSWLIGSSLAEVLTSIIFLFVKHPFDVGDRVTIETATYTVKEIRLLSTIFLDKNGGVVQAPNTVLNTKFLQNIRRSSQMSETFEFHVLYSTTFEQIEALRAKMLAFVKDERRDFMPSFDVVVLDIPEQDKMVLSADIKYKSNWQQPAVKVKRRNKWICAIKTALSELKIYGPGGNPDADSGPERYTEVPWPEVKAADEEKKREENEKVGISLEPRLPRTDYNLSDRNAVVLDSNNDVYGEAEQLNMTNPRRTVNTDRNASVADRGPNNMTALREGQVAPTIQPSGSRVPDHSNMYEMTPNRTARDVDSAV